MVFNLLLVLTLLACTGHHYPTQLVVADSLCAVNPDSALHLLKQYKDSIQTASTADRMYYHLLLADAMNKAYVDMSTDSILKEVADYYDRHGSANEQMRAHYLLGCAYRDMGEAPMALQCYQDAVDKADILGANCNYSLLSKVYAQMGELFYLQNLVSEQVQMIHHSINCSLIAGDTLAAMYNYEQLCGIYEHSGKIDSALYVADSILNWYKTHNYVEDAAITQGRASVFHILLSQTEKARKKMTEYEIHSGLFDKDGNISKGREVYYYYKGLLHLQENNYDSAEYFFRKELKKGTDINNQIAGFKGLAKLFEIKHKSDSAVKYYRYAYNMNDSAYAQLATQDIERIKALYNYSRSQNIAKVKSEEANRERSKRLSIVAVFSILTIFCVLLIYYLYRKGRNGIVKYKSCVNELRKIREEKNALSKHEEEYEQLIKQKDKEILKLELRMKKYGKQIYFNTAVAERSLKSSSTYKLLEGKAVKGQLLNDEDKHFLEILIKEYLPGFDDFIGTFSPRLKPKEQLICMLFRLHFKAVDISGMLGLSKSQVSQVSREILRKVFETDGSSKELYARLSKVY